MSCRIECCDREIVATDQRTCAQHAVPSLLLSVGMVTPSGRQRGTVDVLAYGEGWWDEHVVEARPFVVEIVEGGERTVIARHDSRAAAVRAALAAGGMLGDLIGASS